MNKRKISLLVIGMFAFVGIVSSIALKQTNPLNGVKTLETTMVANDPVKVEETQKPIEEESALSSQSAMYREENMDKKEKPWMNFEPIVKQIKKNNEVVGSYGYAMFDADQLSGMSREDYHNFIDRISKYSFEYFTVVLGDGTGIVYHPTYAYWAMYGKLDDDYYIKTVIHYVDAVDDEVELITEDTKNEVKAFIADITKEYRYSGWYRLEVDLLFDNIYQVDLKINIKNDDFKEAKAAIKEIEQKSKAKGYQLKFNITCTNYGDDIVTMTFGAGNPQYVYIENKHRVELSSLD